MLGSVLKLWHDAREDALDDFGYLNPDDLPTEDSLKKANEHTSMDLLVIDKEASTVYITDRKASIDVGAIAKGYTVDILVERLKAEGADSVALNIGGNIRIIGTKPDGSGWLTGIKDPMTGGTTYAKYITLANTSCVTSGTYERFYSVDGVRYHHIIDKDTLMPSEHFASVSIITKDSGLADALSTALFTMSYEDGLALVTSLGGVEVLWITPEGEQHMTDGFKQLITEAN